MSVDPQPVPSQAQGPHWQAVSRDWASRGTNGAVPNGYHVGQGQQGQQGSGGMPMERWLSEGQNDAAWDNVGAVEEVGSVAYGGATGASGGQ